MEAFKNKIWLSSPTMHGEEIEYVRQVYETNWMSTVVPVRTRVKYGKESDRRVVSAHNCS